MPVSSITSNTTTDTSTTTSASTTLSQNFNTFLTLLTTQLKNQDPLSPMDSSQFTNQLVQYSMVEQQINTNDNLKSLLSQNQTSQLLAGAAYIGKTVEMNSSTLSYDGDNPAKFSVTLPSKANAAVATIYDSSGNIVDSFSVPVTAGRSEVEWDGENSSGTTMGKGLYTVKVTAADSTGASITPSITTYGVVSNVQIIDNDVALALTSGGAVKLDTVVSVANTSS